MEFTKSYLINEIGKFWRMMGDCQYSVESMDAAFQGLCQCYLHIEVIELDDKCSILFEAAANNWQRVRLYRVLGE